MPDHGKPHLEQGQAGGFPVYRDKVVRFETPSGRPLDSGSNAGARQIIATRLSCTAGFREQNSAYRLESLAVL